MTVATLFPSIEDLGDQVGMKIQRQWDTFCRAFLVGPACRQCDEYVRIITGEPHPFSNFAVMADSINADHVAGAIEPLCSLDQPSSLVFCFQPSDETHQLMTEAGFVLVDPLPAMAVDLGELVPTELPAGYEFREVDDDEAWCDTFSAGYGIPRLTAGHFGPAAAAPHVPDNLETRFYAVTNVGRFVCTSLLLLEGGLAGIYCVATVPEFRGKGLGAHATAEPLRRMRERGYRTGVLQSSAMGESVYRRIGFADYGNLLLYVRMPGAAADGEIH